MDFRFTLEEEAWREEVRQFLRETPPESFPIELEDAGFGSGAVSKEFMRVVGSKGWISRFWPKEYGGEGRSMTELLIRKEEFAYAHAPAHSLGMPETVARGIIRRGNDFLKKDILPKIAKGELSFSLGFSEPEAGSDLLALQTSAREDGDYYIINGQKIWNSNAWHSD
jgi:alkylation response protein AidB-like acyl-CoA dehydrogenase